MENLKILIFTYIIQKLEQFILLIKILYKIIQGLELIIV